MSERERAVFDGRTASELARQAAEAVRGINHLTYDDGSVRYPSEVYSVLGDLALVVDRLPQAVRQLGELVRGWNDAGLVQVDSGRYAGDPHTAVAVLFGHLLEVVQACKPLRAALGRAGDIVVSMSWNDSDDDGSDITDAPGTPVGSNSDGATGVGVGV